MAVSPAPSATLLGSVLLSTAAFACAGGARTQESRPVPIASSSAAPPASTPAAAPRPPLPSFEALASQQQRVAPGMHELSRSETSAFPLPKTERDECVRVAFAADAPVRVTLVASDGTTLARAEPTMAGLLDVHGPICFHADARPALRVDGDAGVRYVVWAAP